MTTAIAPDELRRQGAALYRSAYPAPPPLRPGLRVGLAPGDMTTTAALAAFLWSEGVSLVLFSTNDKNLSPDLIAACDVTLSENRGHVYTTAGARSDRSSDPWDLVMFTSGSTGAPKAVGLTRDQVDLTLQWYSRLYRVTEHSTILSGLPPTYNFTFVAVLALAGKTGAKIVVEPNVEALGGILEEQAPASDRCVVIANPVTLAWVRSLEPLVRPNVLLDSGGAPVNTWAIRMLREHGADLHEGYGLTETASLTHFDVEASPESAGTVGHPMPGVHTWIEDVDGKPGIFLRSPNVGTRLDPFDLAPLAGFRPGEYFTSDVGAFDGAGRLRLLGRMDDVPVNGRWPREYLDELGWLLGTRAAIVRQPSESEIHVRVLGPLEAGRKQALTTQLRELAGDGVELVVEGYTGGLLPSMKLPRTPPSLSSRSEGKAVAV